MGRATAILAESKPGRGGAGHGAPSIEWISRLVAGAGTARVYVCDVLWVCACLYHAHPACEGPLYYWGFASGGEPRPESTAVMMSRQEAARDWDQLTTAIAQNQPLGCGRDEGAGFLLRPGRQSRCWC